MNGERVIGLKPEFLWREERIDTIGSAINRYIYSRNSVPQEWTDEYNCHIQWLNDRRNTNE